MKLIYIAGPFRASNSWEVERNIRRAEALALKVWLAGAACICPHTNTRFFQGAGPDGVWLEGDLKIVRRCDAILTTSDWMRSIGARSEVVLAQELELPVFHACTVEGEEQLPAAFLLYLERGTGAR